MLKQALLVVIAAITLWCIFSGEKFDAESLRGKRVIVTGSSTGIGEQLAYHYSRFGAKILITARSENKLKEVAKKCKELGAQQVEIVQADMNFRENRLKVIQGAKDKFGGLDILVLNHVIIEHGLWNGHSGNLTSFRKQFEVDFMSYVDLVSHALPLLQDSKGSIGVISSVAGKIPIPTMASYSASKFALDGFFGSLRQDLIIKKTDISVTQAFLGLIGTDMGLKYASDNNLDTSMAVSPDSTALAIIEGISTKVYNIYYPRSARFIIGLYKICPSLVDRLMYAQYTK